MLQEGIGAVRRWEEGRRTGAENLLADAAARALVRSAVLNILTELWAVDVVIAAPTADADVRMEGRWRRGW